MKVAFDTSVLVAAAVAEHPMHARAAWWFRTRSRMDRMACLHAYAEAWAVLTALPIEPRVSGEVAATVLDRMGKRLSWTPLSTSYYKGAAKRCSGRGARSGAIYDALHLVAAEAQGADVLLTFNPVDFTRLADEHSPRIVVPPDPPGLPG